MVVLLALELTAKESGNEVVSVVGGPAPHFELDVLTAGDLGRAVGPWWRAAGDGRLALEELRGSAVVINFWSSSCRPCRDEARVVERTWQQASRGLLVVGVNQGDNPDTAVSFLKQNSLSLPQLRDPGANTARRWGVARLPVTFFVSRDGLIVSRVSGPVTSEQMQRGIAAALAGTPSDGL